MKNTIATLALTGALCITSPLFAREGATLQKAHPAQGSHASTVFMPEAGVRGFLYFGPSISSVKFDDYDLSGVFEDQFTMYGMTIGGGLIVNGHHYFAVETGFITDSQSYTISPTRILHDTSVDYTSIPLLFSYNYKFDLTDTLSVRAGAMAGLTFWNVEYESPLLEEAFNRCSFTGGATVGITWAFAQNWYLDFAYRFTISTSISAMDVDGISFDTGAIYANQFDLTVGVKF